MQKELRVGVPFPLGFKAVPHVFTAAPQHGWFSVLVNEMLLLNDFLGVGWGGVRFHFQVTLLNENPNLPFLPFFCPSLFPSAPLVEWVRGNLQPH